MALEVAGLSHAEFLTLTPRQLAARCRAVRVRRNRDIAFFAWAVANIMGPHVPKEKMPSVRDMILAAPGFDPDIEDLT